MALKFSSLFIPITDNCGYSCKHCYMGSSPKANRYMTEERFERAIDLYQENSTEKRILKISGGDPLNHPKFRSFVSYATKKIPNVNLGILTTDNMYKRNAEEFIDTIKFLQDNNLRFLSFNTDLSYRNGSFEDLEKVRLLSTELANSGNHFFTVTDHPGINPQYLGNAKKRLSIEECNKNKRSGCETIKIEKINGNSVYPMNVNIEGGLQYCLFGVGVYANISQNINEISKSLLERKIFVELQTEEGVDNIFKFTTDITTQYDHLPPNCSRLQAILDDDSLVNRIEEKL